MDYDINEFLNDLVNANKENEANVRSEEETLRVKLDHADRFLNASEKKFKFNPISINSPSSSAYDQLFYNDLSKSWTYLNQSIETQKDSLVTAHTRLTLALLDCIRILSRDQAATKHLFENDQLLNLIQQIAHLLFYEDKIIDKLTNNEFAGRTRVFILNALKAMSNLIYNSKYAQDFYANNGVAEMISIFLKQFSLADILASSDSTNQLTNDKLNITMFNLRILFLLTVFNKELRNKLREKLQVITYLIEIIDQVMKERLNVNVVNATDSSDSASDQTWQKSASDLHQQQTEDFCYLKSIDIDFIIQILKILYNLTMDIAGYSKINFQLNNSSTVVNNNEEEEAHLMHLVSVLRDLMTCKCEQTPPGSPTDNTTACKLNDLHSNIINLLTNMPPICFEELMTPCNINNNSSNNSHTTNNSSSNSSLVTTPSGESMMQQFKPSNYYLNVRLAHNRKRLSRRSKRMKQKQQQQQISDKQQLDCLCPMAELSIIMNDEDLEFEGKNMEAIAMILAFMNRHVNNYFAQNWQKPDAAQQQQLQQNADSLYPVLLLLSVMSKSNKIIRHYCRLKVLPPLVKNDLVHLPQQGNTMRNKLARLMTDPNLQVKRLSAQFLFILCKESVRRLIKYTGFGNAAGLLAEAGLMLGETNQPATSYSSNSDESDTEDYKQVENCINPVTGRAELDEDACYFDKSSKKYVKLKKDLFENMSDEQKEYEAVRLITELDKLTRLGGLIKPATIGPDGKPREIEHVLELQEHATTSTLLSQLTKQDPNDQTENGQHQSK